MTHRKLKIQTTDGGWTVYHGRKVIGWVRRSEAADDSHRLTWPYWAIRREGLSSCQLPFATVHSAARALLR